MPRVERLRMSEPEDARPRLIGMNHVALEVGDIESAIEWYQSLFAFELRGRTGTKAFLDMGDQFLALGETARAEEMRDQSRHIGLVVDDFDALESRLEALDIERLQSTGTDILDPWGNRLQIVAYADIQFTKADHVLGGMGLGDLEKTDAAREELAAKGMARSSQEG